MKPIARWTIGEVEPIGYEILNLSVKRFSRLYPEFDCVVCHNNIDAPSFLNTFDQQECELNFKIDDGFSWKVVPPRLRIESHELWIDNDLIILDRMDEIDLWLQKNTGIITEGFWDRYYGKFDVLMNGLKLCAGLFGLPPYFDFEKSIIELSGDAPLEGFDEQGLVSYVVSNIPEFITIEQSTIAIIEDHHEFPDERPSGFHFVGANRKNYHRGWNEFKNNFLI